jgi:plastocyanin
MRTRSLLIGGFLFVSLFVLGTISNVLAATTYYVTMTAGNTFQPRSIIIGVGDTVTWQNPAGGLTHSVIADNASFTSPDVLGGQSFSLVFTTAGTIPYHCGHHGAAGGIGMSGTLFVGNRAQHAANEHILEFAAWDFAPGQHTLNGATDMQWGTGYNVDFSLVLTYGGPMFASIHLPTGSEITGLELVGCDSDASNDLWLRLLRCPDPTGACVVIAEAKSIGQPGCGFFSSAPFTELVDNVGSTYLLHSVNYGVPSPEWRSVRVFYRQSISYPPANPTFSDVPSTHPFYRYIEALVASGVTAGCAASPPQYCPDAPLTRGQMAVFLARGLGLFWPN